MSKSVNIQGGSSKKPPKPQPQPQIKLKPGSGKPPKGWSPEIKRRKPLPKNVG